MFKPCSDVVRACRRAEQEAVAAICAASEPAARAHKALALLHVARARELLCLLDMPTIILLPGRVRAVSAA